MVFITNNKIIYSIWNYIKSKYVFYIQSIIDRETDNFIDWIQQNNLAEGLYTEEYLNEPPIVLNSIHNLTLHTNQNPCECTICLDKVENNVEIYKLKCKHVFHMQCLESWLNEKASCPICRKDI